MIDAAVVTLNLSEHPIADDSDIAVFLETWRALSLPLIHLKGGTDKQDQQVQAARSASQDIQIQLVKESGFYQTNLQAELDRMNIRTVILIGWLQGILFQTTSADAYFNGYQVIVPPDGVITDSPEDLQSLLEWLELYFGDLTSLQAILQHAQSGQPFPEKQVEIP